MWSVSFVDLKSLTQSFCFLCLHRATLMLPLYPGPHLSMVFLFISALLPFLLVMRSIISQSFYAQEATAWLLADADKGWCRGCQAIQIISGIKRSIASFSKSSPIPRPPFNPNLFFHWQNKSGETKSNLRVESFKLYCSPEVIYKNQKCQLFFLLRFSFSGSKCVCVCACMANVSNWTQCKFNRYLLLSTSD